MSNEKQLRSALGLWTDHYLARGLQEPGVNGHEFDALMDDLGELIRTRVQRHPTAAPHLVAPAQLADPWMIAQSALGPVVQTAPVTLSDPQFAALAEVLGAAGRAIGQVVADAVAQADKKSGDSPASTPEQVLPDAEWLLILSLLSIECVKETEGFLGTSAGVDEFSLLGQWRYDGSDFEFVHPKRGKFDTGTRLPDSGDFAPAKTLADTEIARGNDYKVFEANILALEEDGMSAAEASTFSHILGGLATLGINALIRSVEVKTGVDIPAEARDAFNNYGLPGLIGVLAKAFGPEAFVPVQIRVRTLLKPNAPNDKPRWRAQITHPEGDVGAYTGSDIHTGEFELREGELVEHTINGSVAHDMIEDLDEGHYKIRVQIQVKQA